MSASTYALPTYDLDREPLTTAASPDQPLHRVGLVRRQQGVALRTVARLLGVTVEEAARQEEETTNLSASDLHRWHQVLEVPIAELLVESDDAMATPVMDRARLIRVMKTAASLQQKAENPGMKRLAETLVQQLVEMMPELAGVGPWHDVYGPRRTLDDLGRIAERRVSTGLSRQLEGDEAA